MNRQKKIILGIILVAVLLMGVGYAALSATNLKITGTASATANEDNFKVVFTDAKTENIDETGAAVGTGEATATVTDGSTSATVAFSGMKDVGDTRSVILEIENRSIGTISAKSVAVDTTVGTDSNFEITAIRCNADGTSEVPGDTVLAKGDKTYVKVTAKLLVAPELNDVTTDKIDVVLIATPQDQTV